MTGDGPDLTEVLGAAWPSTSLCYSMCWLTRALWYLRRREYHAARSSAWAALIEATADRHHAPMAAEMASLAWRLLARSLQR